MVHCAFFIILLLKIFAVDGILYEEFVKNLITQTRSKSKKGPTWVPGINPVFKGMDLNEINSKFLGAQSPSKLKINKKSKSRLPTKPVIGKDKSQMSERARRGGLPASFDWRTVSRCKSFAHVRTQTCRDCWAVASAAVISDRFCLYTNEDRYFSARHITACNGGCHNSVAEAAMDFYVSTGVATGGDPTLPDEPRGCVPYKQMTTKSACPSKCDDGSKFDIRKGRNYRTISKNVTEIQEDIQKYGSVVTEFEVFNDFLALRSGVYTYYNGTSLGYHFVRIIGWGVGNNIPYWLCANQWGTYFAEKGFFKFRRGSNHLNIETWVTAVYPAEAYSKT